MGDRNSNPPGTCGCGSDGNNSAEEADSLSQSPGTTHAGSATSPLHTRYRQRSKSFADRITATATDRQSSSWLRERARANATAAKNEQTVQQVLSESVSGMMLMPHKKVYEERLVVAMVGLPARGKSFIAKKLARYLNWLGIKARVFNVGDYRRKHLGPEKKSDFFDMTNATALQQRNFVAKMCLEDAIAWLKQDGNFVAVFDATNTTIERRAFIHQTCCENHVDTFFVENVCNDPAQVERNIQSVKIGSEDYRNRDPEEAVADFYERMKHYEQAYQPMDPSNAQEVKYSFLRMLTVERMFVVNNAYKYLHSKIVYYLMNLKIDQGCIYLTRHGESEYNVAERIGGNSALSKRGWMYANKLAEFIDKQNLGEHKVWTSTLRRTQQTASCLKTKFEAWKALDELDAGLCDGMTYEEIEANYPREFALRDEDKFNYRYPRGESYRDLLIRLEPCIMELERNGGNVVVIAHQAVLRGLLAYFCPDADDDMSKLPYITVPLHTVIRISPGAYGFQAQHFPIPVPAVDTYRAKPTHAYQ